MEGVFDLAQMLTGGGAAAREKSFYDTQQQIGKNQHLSAQTQQALEQAKVAQLNARKAEMEIEATDQEADAYLALGAAKSAEEARAMAVLGRAQRGNFPQLMQGRGAIQEQGFLADVANPEADLATRLGASSGLTQKVQLAPEGPTPQVSNFAYREGLAPDAQTRFDSLAPPASQGGFRAPSGYRFSAAGDLEHIPGGPADPSKAQVMGAREAAFVQRVLVGASQAIGDARNILELSESATTGTLGVGRGPGDSWFKSTKGMLTNKMAPQEVQDYNSMVQGLSRALATIETAGIVPTGEFTSTFDVLGFREGDTQATKLGKLAQIRQTIEQGLEPFIRTPRTPPELKEYMIELNNEIKDLIPFTRIDVIKLERASNPQTTLGQVIRQRGLNAPTGAAGAPPAAQGGIKFLGFE